MGFYCSGHAALTHCENLTKTVMFLAITIGFLVLEQEEG